MEKKSKGIASRIDPALYRQLKLLSVLDGKPVQELLEEAVRRYVESREFVEEKSDDGEWTVRLSAAPKAKEGEK